jgi:hypothetical protein
MEHRNADPFRIRILGYGLEEIEHRIRWLHDLERDLTGEAGESK